jgi:glycosyltransferase involved in cell wall biosynthesis
MRIVLVNWAKIWEGASVGGGVNGYCQGLALELVRLGHEVSYVSSGMTYVPGVLSSEPGECRVRRHEDYRGVMVYEIINSPVVAPAIFQFREPLLEVSSPELEREFTRLMHLLEPEVVHFHNIEGFSAGCVDAARTASARWPGARVLYSLHNYHTVCPQVYLMQHGRRPCGDFDNGHACVSCVEAIHPHEEKRIRCGGARTAEPRRPPLTTRVALRIKRALLKPPPVHVQTPWPGRAVEAPADVSPPERQDVAEERFATWFDPGSPDWAPAGNDVNPELPNDRAPSPFGLRRRAMVDMLSRCDKVLAVSSFVRRKFEAMGVSRRVLEYMPIGIRMTMLTAEDWAIRADPPGFESGRRIRLVFMGYNNFYKGLHVLTDAMELLVPEVLDRFEFFVYAKDLHSMTARLERLRGRLGGLHLHGAYAYEEIPSLLSGKDLGIVPSVWWDNGPQTVLEFFACGVPVLGSEMGGIPDHIRHDVNGWLFRGNDRFALASRLAALAAQPKELTRVRRNVEAPLEMAVHGARLVTLYENCLASGLR